MSESVRIKSPEGGWLFVKFVALAEVQKFGQIASGILVQIEDNSFPTPVGIENVHPDDYKRLIERYARKE